MSIRIWEGFIVSDKPDKASAHPLGDSVLWDDVPKAPRGRSAEPGAALVSKGFPASCPESFG